MSEQTSGEIKGVTPETLRELVNRVPDLLSITEPGGHFRWVSPSWHDVMGWSFDELTSRPFIEFVHPADRERTLQEAAEIFALGRQAVRFENRYETRSGEFRWLEWNAALSEDGLILASGRDITGRKQAALVELERLRLMEMTEQLAGVGQWRVDLITGLTAWSPRVYQIYGRSPSAGPPSVEEGIAGYHPEDRDLVSDAVKRAIERHEGFSFSARIVRPSGEVRYVECQGVPELNLEGEPVAVLGIFRDVTDGRQLEEAVRRSERMSSIGTMAAGVAHEINNPLSYLMGNLQLIQEELSDRADLPEGERALLLDMIADSIAGSHRVRKIVDGMRAFSRVGKTDSVVQDPAEAIRAALSMAEHQIRMRAQLILELEHRRHVDIDETQLVQVLVNLLVNAAQAIPQGHASDNHVKLSTRDEGSELVITVSDSGPGVPSEVLDRIFDPFFTTKPVGSGTGLGLSICHTIISESRGRIVVDPDAKGGTFRIYLPAVEGTADAPDEPSSVTLRPTTQPRILIVDDEIAVTTMIARALRHDWDTTVCHSGRDALTILDRDPEFDVVLSDLMMPEITGMDMLRYLSAHDPTIARRLIFMTGGTLTPDSVALAEAEGVDVLLKPVDIAELRMRLADRLEEND